MSKSRQYLQEQEQKQQQQQKKPNNNKASLINFIILGLFGDFGFFLFSKTITKRKVSRFGYEATFHHWVDNDLADEYDDSCQKNFIGKSFGAYSKNQTYQDDCNYWEPSESMYSKQYYKYFGNVKLLSTVQRL